MRIFSMCLAFYDSQVVVDYSNVWKYHVYSPIQLLFLAWFSLLFGLSTWSNRFRWVIDMIKHDAFIQCISLSPWPRWYAEHFHLDSRLSWFHWVIRHHSFTHLLARSLTQSPMNSLTHLLYLCLLAYVRHEVGKSFIECFDWGSSRIEVIQTCWVRK